MEKPGVIHEESTLSRWHHELHPSIHKESPRNSLPKQIRTLVHPTHVTLVRENGEDFAWSSRNHRKNRHVDVAPHTKRSRVGSNVWERIGHMRRIEYWNVSWWLAMAFTIGSLVWVVNGFLSFLPFCNSHVAKSASGIGWTAWVGATVFELGSILGVLEAWNRGDTANFGLGVIRSLGGRLNATDDENGYTLAISESKDQSSPKRKWIWFSTDGKYWHELGFLAAFVQWCAATIFWISGFTALPEIQDAISSNTGLLDGVFWTPQVVGGSGFILSATLLMLEVQKKWYLPAPLSLGWQIGVWNLIGAIGFTLCGALGYAANVSSGASYESSLSTFWGGWAFLIGSVIQWYESVNGI